MVAKKKSSNQSANAAEKRAATKKASRTDAAGRSGMGETATSNVTFKKGASVSAAQRTAVSAAMKASKAGGNPKVAYANSLMGAMGAATKKKGTPKNMGKMK